MHFPLLTLLSLAFTAALSTASQYQIQNHCPDPIFITLANPTTTGITTELPAGNFSTPTTISGAGNSVGITKDANYWGLTEYKMIFGYSAVNGTLWWSVNAVNGDPFDGEIWNVTSSATTADGRVVENACGWSDLYGTRVLSCPDEGVELTVHLCVDRA